MENTEELDIDIDDIGTILKSSRLKSKKSMEEISSELCIRKIYLTALEESDYETLPPIPYGVGYVRTYARYLGLNPERAVKLYKAASQVEEQSKDDDDEQTPEANKSNGRHILAGVIALAVLYGGWHLYTVSSVVETANRGTAEESAAENGETAVSAVENDVKTEELPAAETASLENVVSPAEENLQTDNTSADSVKTPAENEAEKVSELPGAGQTPVPEKPAAAEEEAAVLEDNKVVVEFTGESWVELKDRKKVYFQGVFHRGDKKEIDYADNLFLSVGRPHNVKVYVKGMEKNILAKKFTLLRSQPFQNRRRRITDGRSTRRRLRTHTRRIESVPRLGGDLRHSRQSEDSRRECRPAGPRRGGPPRSGAADGCGNRATIPTDRGWRLCHRLGHYRCCRARTGW